MKSGEESFLNVDKQQTMKLIGGAEPFTIYRVLLSVALIFFTFLNTSFLPFQDEIDDYLNFVIRVMKQGIGSPIEAYRESFRTIHNLFLYKLFYYGQFRLFHYLDFRLLPILGNIAFCIAIVKLTDRKLFRLPFRWSIVPTLILFIPLYQVHNWGMVASGSLLRLLLIVLGASCLFTKSMSSFWGLAAVLFLSIQSGTGVLVFAALTVSACLFFKMLSRGKTGLLMLNALLAILVISWRTVEGSPPQISSYSRYFRSIVEYILATYGSAFQYLFKANDKHWCIFIGLLILLILIWQLYLNRSLILKDPIIVTVLIYILMVPALGSTQRWYFTFHHALSDRFVIYSLIIIGCLGFLVTRSLLSLRSKWLVMAFQFCIFLFFIALTWLQVVKIRHHQWMLEEGFTLLQVNPQIEKIYMDKPHGDRFRDILTKAIDEEMFAVPSIFHSKVEQDVLENATFRKIDVSKMQIGAHLDNEILYLHFFEGDNIENRNIKVLFRKVFSQEVFEILPNYYEGKYYAMVDLDKLPDDIGEYSLYLYLPDHQNGAYMGDLNTRLNDLIGKSN